MDIILHNKFDETKVNNNELYREVLVYKVDGKIAYMMAVIEHDGLARSYNMDSDVYFNYENQEDYSDVIQENVLNELEDLAIKQIEDDYMKSKSIVT